MKNVHRIAVALVLVTGLFVASRAQCVVAAPMAPAAKRDKKDVTVVAIRPNASVEARVIRLGDVANITGGDAAFREQLKQLDLEDVLASGESITILPPQIEFRLRIAGIDVERVVIRGGGVRVAACATQVRASEAATVTVTPTMIAHVVKSRSAADFNAVSTDEGPLEREVIRAAKNCVLSKLPWPEENVDIRLAQPISNEVRRADSAVGYEYSVEQRSSGPAVGRVQVRVIAEAPRGPAFDVPVVLEVRHFDRVVLTTKAIERGHVLVAEDLYVDRQDVTDLSDYCSSSSSMIGATTKRAIRALQPMRTNDIDPVGRAETAVLVKRREQVKMTANVGVLNVSATGEAQQEGRLGETIRLRNLDSNTNVRGRVIGPNEVEILF